MIRPPISAAIHAAIMRSLLLVFFVPTIIAGCGPQQRGATQADEPLSVSGIIRVKIGPDATEQTLTVSGPFQIYDTATRRRLMNPSSMARGTFTASPDGLQLNGRPLNSNTIEIVPQNSPAIRVFAIAATSAAPSVVEYRGNMRVISLGQNVRLVNVLKMDDYLYSVVGKETYSARWHIESQKAQAIAARSYALVEALSGQNGRDFDVYDSPGRSQAYPGTSSETDKSRRAADETSGLVLTHSLNGQCRILHAFYSSTCGGSTVAAETVFAVTPCVPLAGVECQWCRDTRNYRWNATVSQVDLLRAFAPLLPQVRMDEILAFEIPPDARRPDGSVKAVKVIFRSGQRREIMAIKAEKLRSVLGTMLIKSTCITGIDIAGGQAAFQGRGFGHRVGMCQFGAEEQARAGRSAETILQHYYPTAQLTKVY